jgi:hypothetical protein
MNRLTDTECDATGIRVTRAPITAMQMLGLLATLRAADRRSAPPPPSHPALATRRWRFA